MPLAVICTYSHVGSAPLRKALDVTLTTEIDPESSTIGIADSSLYGMSRAEIDETLTKLQGLGVQSVRVLVPWGLIKMTGPDDLPNDYNWSLMNDVMASAAAHNMGVLAVISHTPPYAGFPNVGAPDPAAYGQFVKEVATRYGNVISAYEIWNEPNQATSYLPVSAASYTEILKAAWNVLKGDGTTPGLDPTANVIAGALYSAQTDPFFGTALSPQDFVNAMYLAGAKGFFDAISVHPYEWQQILKFSDYGQYPLLSALSQVEQVRAIMVQNGDEDKLIWASEYGVTTQPYLNGQVPTDEAKQADFITDFINAWRALTYTGPLFIYTTRDGTTAPNGEVGYGIFNADWTPKLAATAIANAIHLPPVVVPVIEPIVALVQWIQQAFAQAQQAFATFTASLQAAVANAVKAFTDLVTSIFNPAAAQVNPAASLASAAATINPNALAAAKVAATELKAQVVGSKDTSGPAAVGDKTEAGAEKVVDVAVHEAAGAVDPKAVETKVDETKTEVKTETPKTETETEVKTETPKTDDTKTETVTEVKTETPKTDDTKTEVKTETPKTDDTKTEVKTETPKSETPAGSPKTTNDKSTNDKSTNDKSTNDKSTTNESKKPAKDPAGQDKSSGGKDKPGAAGADKEPSKVKAQTPAASEPSKPAGRTNGDTAGKTSSTDGSSHQGQGA